MLPHFEVQDKILGVIGAGAIGRQVIKIAEALRMRVVVYSRSQKSLGNSNARFVSFEELLRESDFVSIHSPLTAETRHMINKETLSLMKHSSFIINTSRGAIINENDLIEALNRGVIAGAALDVQDPEPPQLDNPLFLMGNVILTPHIGWKCFESRQRLIKLLAQNIKAFIEGNPTNVVN
jgi:glycerate dehydrogenase